MREIWRGARSHPVFGHLLRFRPLALVVALLMVLATATATAEAPTGDVIYDKFHGQDVRLSIPPTADPKGVAIFFHGQTGGVDNRMDEPWLQGLMRSGWIVASSDFHTASWGNEVSTQDTKELIAWAEEQTGEPVRLFVSGSMGGTVSLNAMLHGVDPPACWYGVKPAVDPTRMDAVPGANRIIYEAYGGEPIPDDRNPAMNIDSVLERHPLPVRRLQGRPVGPLRREHRPDGRQPGGTRRQGEHARGVRHPRRPVALQRRRPGRLRRQVRRVAQPSSAAEQSTRWTSILIATRVGFSRGCR